jgi:tetratricopeptide (TPR) repeat protein
MLNLMYYQNVVLWVIIPIMNIGPKKGEKGENMNQFRLQFRLFFIILAFSIAAGSLSGCSKSAQTLYEDGMAFYESEKYDQAIRFFQKAKNKDPNHVEAYYMLGECYFRLRDLESAEGYFKHLLDDKDPKHVKTHLRLGELYVFDDKPDSSLKYLNALLEFDPGNIDALLWAGTAYTKKRDFEEGEKTYLKILEIDPQEYRAFGGLGDLSHSNGDSDKAIEYYKKAISIKEDFFAAYFNLGVVYTEIASKISDPTKKEQQNSFYAMALEAMEKALELNTEDIIARIKLGDIYNKAGKSDKAIETIQPLVDRGLPSPLLDYVQGVAYTRQGEFRKAIRSLQLAAKRMKGSKEMAEIHFLLGASYLENGQVQQAISELQIIVKAAPNFVEGRLMLARAYMEAEFVDLAMDELRISRKLDPENKFANDLMIKIQIAQGEMEKSREMVEEQLARDPGNIEALLAMGTIEIGGGKVDEAEEWFLKAFEAEPENSRVHDALGTFYFNVKGDPEKAEKHLRKALSINPGSINALLRLADLMLSQNNLPESLTLYSNVLTRRPDNNEALKGRAAIYNYMGNSLQAINEYKSVLKNDEYDFEALSSLGLLYNSVKEYRKADAIADKLFELGIFEDRKPFEALANFIKASSLAGQKKYTEAENLYLKSLKLDPNSIQTYFVVSFLALIREDYDTARERFEKCLELSDKWTGAHINLALLDQREKDFESALSHLEKVKETNSEYNALGIFQSNLYVEMGRFDEAAEILKDSRAMIGEISLLNLDMKEIFGSPDDRAALMLNEAFNFLMQGYLDEALAKAQKALQTAPDNPIIANMIPTIVRRMGDMDTALETYIATAEKFPNLANVQFQIADIYYIKNEFNKAEEYYRKALKLNPELALAHFQLANIYQALNKNDKAIQELKKTVELEPESPLAHNNLAWFYSEIDVKLEEAEKHAVKAYEIRPGDPNIIDTLGWIYHLQGKNIEARDLLEKAAVLNPNEPYIRYHYGMALKVLKQRAAAIFEFEKALEIDPDFGDAEKANAELKALGN